MLSEPHVHSWVRTCAWSPDSLTRWLANSPMTLPRNSHPESRPADTACINQYHALVTGVIHISWIQWASLYRLGRKGEKWLSCHHLSPHHLDHGLHNCVLFHSHHDRCGHPWLPQPFHPPHSDWWIDWYCKCLPHDEFPSSASSSCAWLLNIEIYWGNVIASQPFAISKRSTVIMVARSLLLLSADSRIIILVFSSHNKHNCPSQTLTRGSEIHSTGGRFLSRIYPASKHGFSLWSYWYP